MASKSASISIRYAELNGEPVTKRVRAGMTVKQFAEELSKETDTEIAPSDLFVDGKKVGQNTKLAKDSFVVLITNVSGG